jgi:DNA replication protein DnaC
MSISPILLNGSIQQTDNVLHNQLRQAEKGLVDQGNIQVQTTKKEHELARRVANTEESLLKEGRHDAKEKGHNEYTGDGGARRRRKDSSVAKAMNKSAGGFDIRI